MAWMDGWMNGWMNQCIDVWVDGWMDVRRPHLDPGRRVDTDHSSRTVKKTYASGVGATCHPPSPRGLAAISVRNLHDPVLSGTS